MILNTIINISNTNWLNIIKLKKIVTNKYINNLDKYIKNKNKKRKLFNWLLRKKRIKYIFGFGQYKRKKLNNIRNINNIWINLMYKNINTNNDNNKYIEKNSDYIKKKIKLFNQSLLNKKKRKFNRNKWKKY